MEIVIFSLCLGNFVFGIIFGLYIFSIKNKIDILDSKIDFLNIKIERLESLNKIKYKMLESLKKHE